MTGRPVPTREGIGNARQRRRGAESVPADKPNPLTPDRSASTQRNDLAETRRQRAEEGSAAPSRPLRRAGVLVGETSPSRPARSATRLAPGDARAGRHTAQVRQPARWPLKARPHPCTPHSRSPRRQRSGHRRHWPRCPFRVQPPRHGCETQTAARLGESIRGRSS